MNHPTRPSRAPAVAEGLRKLIEDALDEDVDDHRFLDWMVTKADTRGDEIRRVRAQRDIATLLDPTAQNSRRLG